MSRTVDQWAQEVQAPLWKSVTTFVVVICVQAFVAVSLLPLLAEGPAHPGTEYSCWTYVISSLSRNVVILAVLWATIRRTRGLGKCITTRPPAVGFLIVPAMTLCLLPLDVMLGNTLSYESSSVAFLHEGPTGMCSWIAVACLVLLGPTSEELFFRGYFIFLWLRKSNRTAIIVSTLAFSLYHFDGSYSSLIVQIPFGLTVGYGVVVTRSVWTAVAAHTLWNCVALVVGNKSLGWEPEPIVVAGMLGCLILGGVLLKRATPGQSRP